jgi:hypothetical protein
MEALTLRRSTRKYSNRPLAMQVMPQLGKDQFVTFAQSVAARTWSIVADRTKKGLSVHLVKFTRPDISSLI